MLPPSRSWVWEACHSSLLIPRNPFPTSLGQWTPCATPSSKPPSWQPRWSQTTLCILDTGGSWLPSQPHVPHDGFSTPLWREHATCEECVSGPRLAIYAEMHMLPGKSKIELNNFTSKLCLQSLWKYTHVWMVGSAWINFFQDSVFGFWFLVFDLLHGTVVPHCIWLSACPITCQQQQCAPYYMILLLSWYTNWGILAASMQISGSASGGFLAHQIELTWNSLCFIY